MFKTPWTSVPTSPHANSHAMSSADETDMIVNELVATDHTTLLPIDVVVAVIDESDWETMCAWRATCRAFFTLVALRVRRRYESYVAPFAADVLALDKVLLDYGAIISGATALHFFVPDSAWEPRELDLYVPADTYKPFVRALVDPGRLNWKRIPSRKRKRARPLPTPLTQEAEQDSLDEYHSDEHMMCRELPVRPHRVPRDDTIFDEDASAEKDDNGDDEDDTFPDHNQDDYNVSYIQMEHHTRYRPVMVYGTGYRTTRSYRTTTGRRVNVVASHTVYPITPLRAFWTTLCMNFLTPRGAICGFPSATLHRQGALKVDPLTDRERVALDRYERRGFAFDDILLRQRLEFWDILFFGERRLLAVDFRTHLDARECVLPIKKTGRGWLPNFSWRLALKPAKARRVGTRSHETS